MGTLVTGCLCMNKDKTPKHHTFPRVQATTNKMEHNKLHHFVAHFCFLHRGIFQLYYDCQLQIYHLLAPWWGLVKSICLVVFKPNPWYNRQKGIKSEFVVFYYFGGQFCFWTDVTVLELWVVGSISVWVQIINPTDEPLHLT